ncbi:MAG TPA: GAF domain-containing SpoIIE family protein phosphatase, partial [Solirubrobacteraceae bacterium]|nr:GAF domain-containing SpoIIE family protein phosphatase [Solirubrobacteraceae bacterium]
GEIIGVLSVSAHRTGSFSEPDRRLLEVVGERVALAIGQVQLRDREQRLAETVQRTLLPQTLPDLPGVTLRARYLPHSAGVGGDFYDAIRLPGGRVGVAIGDITGKGLRAAATMGRLRSALHAYALDASRPADVLNRLGRFAQVDGAMATALYLVLDPATGWMELASAGHLPPLGIGAGETAFIDVRAALSPPLGWAAERHAQLRLRLPPGRGLLLYTDGLVELTHNLDEGMRRLAGAADAAPAGSLDAFCDHLLGVVAGDDRYHDDVAMLVLRRDD